MKWGAVVALVVVVGLFLVGVLIGGEAELDPDDVASMKEKVGFLVPALDDERVGPGCRPFTARCELRAGRGRGRVVLRVKKQAPRQIRYEPKGPDAVALTLRPKVGEAATLTVPEEGATLILDGCSPSECEVTVTPR